MALPFSAYATSASISVSGNEGAVSVSATGSFSTHKFCTGTGDDEECWNDSSGTLYIYHQSSRLERVPGTGGASWSDVFNAGTFSQGEHVFTATACDSKNICESSARTITIDNTPTVSIAASGDDGPIDVRGTVDFKENTAGNEGTIKLYYDAYNDGRYVALQGQKSFEGADLTNWTWEEITGTVINAGALPQGENPQVPG